MNRVVKKTLPVVTSPSVSGKSPQMRSLQTRSLPIVPPPAIPEISFALAAPSRAAPGDQITVTWNISTNSDLAGYHAVIDYDEAVLAFEAARVNREWLAPARGDGSIEYISPEDGNLVIAVVTDYFLRTTLPAGPARVAAEIDFTVNPQTQASATELLFVDANAVVLLQQHPTSPDRTSVEVQVDPAGGAAVLAIQREAEFLRGGVNDDGAIDISDPISALSFLFLGTSELPCKDAADANDDGTVDISDPIADIRYLFRDGVPLPEPFGGCGRDPTEDPLGCNSYSAPARERGRHGEVFVGCGLNVKLSAQKTGGFVVAVGSDSCLCASYPRAKWGGRWAPSLVDGLSPFPSVRALRCRRSEVVHSPQLDDRELPSSFEFSLSGRTAACCLRRRSQ